jgi:hypothetical protein
VVAGDLAEAISAARQRRTNDLNPSRKKNARVKKKVVARESKASTISRG